VSPTGVGYSHVTGRAFGSNTVKTYIYDVDFHLKSLKMIRKDTFRRKPQEYLEAGSNSKLPLDIQAAYQAARKFLNHQRLLRQITIRRLTTGRKDWLKYFHRLEDFTKNLGKDRDLADFVGQMVHIYGRFCIDEVSRCWKQLRFNFRITNTELSTCPVDRSYKPSFLKKDSRARHSSTGL